MIYAKVYETVHPVTGETMNALDWGHIITSPQGLTPEEMGYLPFESVAEAKEYFNITDEQ